ncbi:hypothetical protein CAC42_6684 [Sphaceloma murrayae]|uniref:Uncharacterized protein n=1 Tax=Sphaceloma murrayae TaxID=2082308 RepID=A0A2K1QGX5_9PEZI|nr:hypothetical protein CAC42_6684 [Sphaceloma murrayae]
MDEPVDGEAEYDSNDSHAGDLEPTQRAITYQRRWAPQVDEMARLGEAVYDQYQKADLHKYRHISDEDFEALSADDSDIAKLERYARHVSAYEREVATKWKRECRRAEKIAAGVVDTSVTQKARDDYARLRAELIHMAELRSENASLLKMLKRAESAKVELKQRMKVLERDRILEAERLTAKHQATSANAAVTIDGMQEAYNDLQQNFRKLQNLAAGKDKSIDLLRRNMEGYKKEVNNVKAAMAQLEQDHERLEKDHERLEKDHERHRKQRDDALEEIGEEQRVRDLMRARSRTDSAAVEITDMRAEISKQKALVSALKDSSEEKSSQVEMLQSQLKAQELKFDKVNGQLRKILRLDESNSIGKPKERPKAVEDVLTRPLYATERMKKALAKLQERRLTRAGVSYAESQDR